MNRKQRRAAASKPQPPTATQPPASDVFAVAIEHHRAGRLADAERLYRLVLAADPRHADSLNLLGVIAAQTGHADLAIDRIGQAIAIDEGVASYHNNLGEVLRQAGRLTDAMGHFRRALDLTPDYADAHNNLGAVCHGLGHLDEAIIHYRQALSLRPDYPEALNNLGAACQEQGELDEAARCYREALARGFDDGKTRANLGTVLLAKGDFKEGWRLYEWRERGDRPLVVPRHVEQPRWRGDDLAGRTLLLHGEQGLGDCLQFARYATLAASRGACVILEVPPALRRLLATVPGVAMAISAGDPLPPFDCHLPLMSAPYLFGTEPDSIPADIPYVRPDPAAVASWSRRLAALSGVKAGLVWAGAPRPDDLRVNAIDRRRSMALAQMAPILGVAGVSFVSLQKGAAAVQIAALAQDVRPLDPMDEIGDFADTAALVANLDLVISVDTAVAHLAGAMGKPVWILSRFDNCWRWLTEREDSPWYPTARLFRQKAPGDWPEVVARVADALGQKDRSLVVSTKRVKPQQDSGSATFPGFHIAARPGWTPPMLAQARVFHQAGRDQEAEPLCRRLLANEPDQPAVLHLLGLILARLGRPDEAVAALRNAIALDGDDADVHFDLGVVLQSHGRPMDAERAYRSVLALRPDHAMALNNLGNALRDQGRQEEAAEAFRTALRWKPDYAEAYFNFGILRHKVGRLAEAIEAYRGALALKPDFPGAQTNLGAALQELGRLQEAETVHRAAVTRWPQDPTVQQNFGVMLTRLRRPSDAAAAFHQALRHSPDYATAHVNLAHALLLGGDFAAGWREYEWRWKGGVDGLMPLAYSQPLWQGEDIAGRTVLLYAEQGLGDSLQFARFAESIAARGGRVVLQVQPSLQRLLATVPGVAETIASEDTPPPFDVHLPMMSAPFVLGTTLTTIPAKIPYVTPDAEAVETWRRRLSHLAGTKIGLVWGGSPRKHDIRLQATDRRRSMALSTLSRLLATRGATFVSLQKGEPAAEIADLAAELRPLDLMDEVADFADTAALVANLDLVISVDTSVVHLAGAMGKPVWLLSRFDGCWRWLMDRDDSPWYPSLRIFHQSEPENWQEVVERVQRALEAWPGPSGATTEETP
ncbi:tetratricopeptide repeat protein [Telmatospirillum sp.]|uniref:tetratricopeptide repeat protein n=1 Tax=Telmatospirillum sp. TaxID=2079197 RepID=UPI002846E3DD|nr:tetratricopeptide repeat protein [Telmatospirillum sp.]MDR3438543.1 tetratricopeptide repeat protein [Telmatospirillum sp.]